jgi:hypothetical protein
MRWLKWVLVAVWLAVHAWLWALLLPVPRWRLPGVTPLGLGFTSDGRSLVTCDDQEVTGWDALTGRREQVWPRPAGSNSVRIGLVVAPAGRRVIVYNRERRAPHLIDLDTGDATDLPSFGIDISNDGFEPDLGYFLQNLITFAPDGRTILQLIPSFEQEKWALRVWDVATGTERLILMERRPYGLSVSADGRSAVAVLGTSFPEEPYALVFDLIAARIRHTLRFDMHATSAVLSPDGRTVAISGTSFDKNPDGEAEVQFWDAGSGRRIASIGEAFSPGWNADSRLILIDSRNIRLIDAPGGAEVAHGPAPPIGLAYTHDVAPGGRFALVTVRNYLPEPVRWVLQRLPGEPFDPDLERAVYYVYDARTGRPRGAIGVDERGVTALAPDGSALATTDRNGVRVWDIPPRKPGGIVLLAMIAQVGALTAWTAWRRLRRTRPGVRP